MLKRFSALIVVVAVAALASSSSAIAEVVPEGCPCHHGEGDNTSTVCDDTSLTSIPECVGDVLVTSLSIRTPSIPLVPGTIRRFKNLRGLSVEYFDDPQLSKVFLDGQRDLPFFKISQTSLEYVDKDWFKYAPDIRTLVLSGNKIGSLDSDTFNYLPQLETVHLDGNRLSTLTYRLFVGKPLKSLYLDGNSWHCNSGMAEFMPWTKRNRVTVPKNAFCAYPVEMRGLLLHSVN